MIGRASRPFGSTTRRSRVHRSRASRPCRRSTSRPRANPRATPSTGSAAWRS